MFVFSEHQTRMSDLAEFWMINKLGESLE